MTGQQSAEMAAKPGPHAILSRDENAHTPQTQETRGLRCLGLRTAAFQGG
jgi:hypothetical protein